jgi:tetratricopeptide (TPR) repeat protein
VNLSVHQWLKICSESVSSVVKNSSAAPPPFLVRWGVILAGGLIVLAALAAYHNSFSGPFILDDPVAITDNPSIKHLGSALSPPASSTAGGRPLLNLTYALNYALGGLNVWGYHAVNLAIHIFAGLALFGLVRRTLLERSTCNIQRPTSKANPSLDVASNSMASSQESRFAGASTSLAFFVAVIWVVHPLQTEAVTYISQRAESLMGLFYLLTLYCFVRGAESKSQASGVRHQVSEVRNQKKEIKTQNQEAALHLTSGLTTDASRLWYTASVLCCALGMATKEIMVTAPLMVLLYDRTFVAGSFRAAWQSRWRYYLGLACTWLLLARLMTGTGLDQRDVGFDRGVTWWSYALTSCRSVVLYLKLAFWPHPLVLDYGSDVVHHMPEVAPYMLILAGLIAATAMALWRRPVIGFAGAWFFVILAPASSVIPVAGQPMAEHRMYLPLAAVVLLVLSVLYRLLGRRAVYAGAGLAILLIALTFRRNQDYQNEIGLWRDTVAKQPDNARARNNLGLALINVPGHLPEAMAECQAALRLKPDYAEAHNNLGLALSQVPGHLPDAAAEFEAALRLKPDNARMHSNLGNALAELPGRLPDAIAEYQAALRLKPDYAEVHANLGNALAQIPERLPEALAEYEAALRLKPDYAKAHTNLGIALARIPGRLPEAILHFESVVRLDPDSAEARFTLASALLKMPERLPEAIAQYEAVLRIKPDSAEAHNNLGNILFNLPGRLPEAIDQYEAALRLNPNSVSAHFNLGNALLKMPGRTPDAIEQFKAALRLNPDLKPAKEMLSQLQKEKDPIQR